MRIVLFLSMLLTSCVLTEKDLYQALDIPTKPENGYDRFEFTSYDDYGMTSSYISARGDNWIAQESNFKKLYSDFDVELIAVNQAEGKEFSWKERLVFADALDMVIMVANHPSFIEKMQIQDEKTPFSNNEQTVMMSATEVVNSIRSAKLYFYLAKDDLPADVLAQATVTGYHNTIWFRSDIDYSTESVLSVAEILFHEMTHNLGYLHSSNVPHGVQTPFLSAMANLTQEDIDQFVKNTPYYEDEFLTRVRTMDSAYSISHNQDDINTDYVDDIIKH